MNLLKVKKMDVAVFGSKRNKEYNIKMVLNGRMGNQFFQFVTGYFLSKALNANFFIDEKLSPFLLDKYFNLPEYKLVKHNLLNKFRFNRYDSITENEISSLKKILNTIIDNKLKNIILIGYFQSEKHFMDLNFNNLSINNFFKLKKEYKINRIKDEVPTINDKKKNLVLHVRRTDYKDAFMQSKYTNFGSAILPHNYYLTALNKFPLKDYNIIVIGDDTSNVEKEFQEYSIHKPISNSLIVDFQLLMYADSLIISNSSFAWWGAYLNKKNAKVIAPLNWIGFKTEMEYPQGICSVQEWNWLSSKECKK